MGILSGCIWALYDRVLELEKQVEQNASQTNELFLDYDRVFAKTFKLTFDDLTSQCQRLENLFSEQQQANNALPKLHTARGKDGRFVRK